MGGTISGRLTLVGLCVAVCALVAVPIASSSNGGGEGGGGGLQRSCSSGSNTGTINFTTRLVIDGGVTRGYVVDHAAGVSSGGHYANIRAYYFINNNPWPLYPIETYVYASPGVWTAIPEASNVPVGNYFTPGGYWANYDLDFEFFFNGGGCGIVFNM